MLLARDRKTLLAGTLLLALLLAPLPSQAHSLRAIYWRDAAMVVQVSFGGGDVASYAQVLVFPPDENQTEYQSGVTDAHGRFAFVPDRPGIWRVIINAGMGHQTALAVDISAESMKSYPQTNQ